MKYNSELLTGEITLSHTKEEFVKLKSHHSGSHTVVSGYRLICTFIFVYFL